jgi:hypothetical protein
MLLSLKVSMWRNESLTTTARAEPWRFPVWPFIPTMSQRMGGQDLSNFQQGLLKVPPSQDFHTFDHKAASLKIIMAAGCDMVFAQHCGHGPNTAVHFFPVDTPKSVYRAAGIHGSIGGNGFDRECVSEPKGDLVVQKNPTCTVQDYQGGVLCCRHEQYLLDSDQEIPWQDQPQEDRLKFRFYFENYQAATGNQPPSHKKFIDFSGRQTTVLESMTPPSAPPTLPRHSVSMSSLLDGK